MKYRKKPVVIEAVKWIGNHSDMFKFIDTDFTIHQDSILIPTLEGEMTAKLGDYIIKGVKGEFYPCKPDIFEATYDLVD